MQWNKITGAALSLIFTILTGHAPGQLAPTSSAIAPFAGRITTSHYGNVPLMFEANQGQTDSQVKFLSRGSGYPVFLTSGGTVEVEFIPASSGPISGILRFLDSAGGSSQVVALSGSGTDFVTSLIINQATVRPGGTAAYKLNISPTGRAYSDAVTFACSGAPAFSTCTVSPGSIIPGGNSSTVSVSVTTSGPAAQMGGVRSMGGGLLAYWLSSSSAVFGVLVLGANKKCKSRRHARAAVMVVLLLLVGCGGTGRSPVASNTTPPGTYNLSVVATSGTLQHVTKLTLMVQ